MAIKIALAGNPNCGKTTMFNDLTGSSQYVGNWPGVTVEKKEGKLKGHKDVIITDLPGIYSLSPYSLEEVVSRNYLINEKPDAIVNIVDATNLERNLYLTTQVLELGIPVVIALNMMDIVKKTGDKINVQKLASTLGCAVVETSALKGQGSIEAAEKAISLANQQQTTESQRKFEPQHKFSNILEKAFSSISGIVKDKINPEQARWYEVKLFERDQKVLEMLQLSQENRTQLENIISSSEEQLGDDSETVITDERYNYIAEVIGDCVHKSAKSVSASDKIDRIVTNRFLAIPIFAAIMFVIYYVSVTTIGSIATDWVNDTLFGSWITNGATTAMHTLGAANWLSGLIVDGIINGVGTVLGFIPQMLVLFFFLAILEDSGYMARVAFIMDRIFRRFGLSGKSFIPILIGTGCGVPAIMATRAIESERDRKMTIMLTTFMPCSAKTVIIAMITTTFFPKSFWIAPAMYFLGIAVIIMSGIMLKKTALFAGEPSSFVMELPPYHVPAAKGVAIHMWERSRAFAIKAGTVIFTACVVIWFLTSFGWNMHMVNIENSMLAGIGHVIAVLFAPLGFGSWKGAVATISALMAKESAISTLAVLNGVADADNTQAVMHGIITMFSSMGAFSFMILNLFDPPCIVAMATTRREMGTARWTAIAIGYQVLLGYSLAFIANQLGSFFFYGVSFGIGQVLAVLLVLLAVFLMVRPATRRKSTLNRAGVGA